MPDDGIMLTLMEWSWIVALVREARRQAAYGTSLKRDMAALEKKLADRLNLDLEKLDG